MAKKHKINKGKVMDSMTNMNMQKNNTYLESNNRLICATDVSLKVKGLWGLGAKLYTHIGEIIEEIGRIRKGEDDMLTTKAITLKLAMERAIVQGHKEIKFKP